MPRYPEVTTLAYDANERGIFAQMLLTPFGASLKPALICLAVTGMWFFLFWGPYKSNFADLFPVSQWLWLPLLLIITGIAPTLFHHQFITRQKREKCFIEFCIATAGYGNAKQICEQYVLNHRTKTQLDDGRQDITILIGRHSELYRLWNLSVAVEKQARPFGLTAFSYICVWVFCLSVPFVYWSFYEGYGLLGWAFVTWPILAVIYGPLNNTNQFDDPAHNFMVISDYMKRVDAYFSSVSPSGTQQFAVKS